MRIRTVKPEFWTSESMGRVSREARLCFVGIWSMSDDEGRTRAASRLLASLLYPYDELPAETLEGWLQELAVEKCIIRYEVAGNHYIQVRNWLHHQKIDRPSKSKLPPPPEDLANPREPSRTLDVGSGNGIRDQGTPTPPDVGLPEEWKPLADPEHIASYLRELTSADPSPSYLAMWRAAMADLAARRADPAAVIRGLEAYAKADPAKRPGFPQARFLNADWFLGIVAKTTKRQHIPGED